MPMTDRLMGPPPGPAFELVPSADEITFFHENGYLAVERITTDEELSWIREIFDHIFSADRAGKAGAPLDRSGTPVAGNKAGSLSQAFFPEMHFPQLLNSQYRRNAKRYAAALLGVEDSKLSSWGHMIRKMPGGRAASWHQDHAYWEPELDYHALGVWMALQPVSVEMGAMQFLPGSHKRGLLVHRQEDKPEHNVLTVAGAIDESKAVACPLKQAGATFHHFETLHYTAPNRTSIPRLAFPMEFQVAPVKRERPLAMPWVDEHRATTDASRPFVYVADGKVLSV